jgi:hypothetical protein
MTIKVLSDVIREFYNRGRTNATSQTFALKDIQQMAYEAAAGIFRTRYYESKKEDEYGEPDYSFISPLLSIQRFKLGNADIRGMRRADMNTDLFRMPKNSHFTNLYLVTDGCAGDGLINGKIPVLKNGEEYFYTGEEYSDFLFVVSKGNGLDTYHFPPCVTDIEVETTYANEDAEISLEVAYDVSLQVLGVMLRVPGFTNKGVDNSFVEPLMALLKRQQDPNLGN